MGILSFDVRRYRLEPRRVFDFLDRDKDSRLSYLEFRAWILLIDRSVEEHELLQIFDEIDRNGQLSTVVEHWCLSDLASLFIVGDGAIEYKEFRDYFGVDVFSEEPSDAELRLLFDELDLQQTGELSLEKLLAFFNRQNPLISREEGERFLGIASKTDNESTISYSGNTHISLFLSLASLQPEVPFRVPSDHVWMENLTKFQSILSCSSYFPK